MNKDPETTVVITCFNYGHYLEGCLRSVLDQTYGDYEIIVIDDGSTDSTPEVMKAFSGLSNLRYIRQENFGQAKAKNRGIKSARGRYVAFLDADDRWERDKLERQVRLFENPAVGVVYSLARLIDDEGAPLDLHYSGEYLKPRSGKVSRWLFLDNFVWFSSSVVRRECFEKHGIFDESLKMGIDWDLWLRISTQCEFDFVDEPLLLYRMGHSGQMSKNVEIRQQCSDRIMENFLKKYPGAVNAETVREGQFITFCNRANYYRRIDKKKSFDYFFRALKMKPFNRDAYKGLIKNLINSD